MKTISDQNVNFLKNIETLNIKNTQLSEELVTKTGTINSLEKQNKKLSTEKLKIIENNEEEITTYKLESKANGKAYEEALYNREKTIETIENEKQAIEETNSVKM